MDSDLRDQPSCLVTIYCDNFTDLQSDKTLRRVHEHLVGIKTDVRVERRPVPCTLVTVTWVEGDEG